jgi:acetyl esterase
MMSTLSQLTATIPEEVETELITISTPRGDIAVRLYWPSGASPTPRPLLVWLHGGGWVIGDLQSADPTARDLAVQTGAIVASVDYPLAPESPFPAAPEACYAAASWLAGHAGDLGADPGRVAIGGDSAGGNLAAVTALLARDRGGPTFKLQLLVYPVTDCLMSYPSVKENGEGYLLTASAMHWFIDHYLASGTDPRDPAASPIYAGDLKSLPPALVITAEFDPLRDEGEAYAAQLDRTGVPVTSSRYDGMIHGFFGMTGVIDAGRDAVREAAEALKRAFSS